MSKLPYLVENDESDFTSEILYSWKKNDEESPKLREWIERGMPSAQIVLKVQEDLPIRPSSYLGERSLFIGRFDEISKAGDLIRTGVKTLTIVGEKNE